MLNLLVNLCEREGQIFLCQVLYIFNIVFELVYGFSAGDSYVEGVGI